MNMNDLVARLHMFLMDCTVRTFHRTHFHILQPHSEKMKCPWIKLHNVWNETEKQNCFLFFRPFLL